MKNVEEVSSILNIIREYSEKNPELRFHQILWGLRIFESNPFIIDKFSETSSKTLKDLKGKIK